MLDFYGEWHIIKVRKKERMILSIVLTKAKENPLTELPLQKGVFFLVLTGSA